MRANFMTKQLARAAMGCLAALVLAAPAGATVFVDEPFSYSDGDLTTVSGGSWTAYSSPTGNPVLVSSQKALVVGAGASAQDVHRSLGATLSDGDTFYYAAKFSLTGSSPMSTVEQYFIGLKDATSSTLNARLYVDNPQVASSTKFSLGITAGSQSDGEVPSLYPTDLNFGQDYVVVVGFTSDPDGTAPWTGEARLWVNPVNSSSTSAVNGTPASTLNDATDEMDRVFLRQGSGAATIPTMNLDDLAVGDDFDQVLAAVSGAPAVDADFDNDTDTDGNDFLIWQRGVGIVGGAANGDGDATGEGNVDGLDLAAWEAEFGTAVAASQPIPEPATLALAACAVAGIVGLTRRRA